MKVYTKGANDNVRVNEEMVHIYIFSELKNTGQVP
jgi:hypothetical protein